VNREPLDILGLASSEPEYNSNGTGVGGARHYLFKELAKRYTLRGVFQPRPTGLSAMAGRLASWVPNPEIAHRAYKRHRWVFDSKTRACEAFINAMPVAPSLVFQWEFFFAPYTGASGRAPYVVYNDWTTKLSEREFPEWALPRVRAHINRLQGDLMRGASFVFTFSDKVRRSVVDDYGVAPEQAVTAYAGVNIDNFPEPIERRDRSRVTILFAGNDYFRKGLGDLLEAFRAVRENCPMAELVVIGDPGPSYSVRPEPNVTFLGHIADKWKLSELYADADVFVLPTRTEAFGHVYAEAMAHSLPCIGTDVGAVGEVILDGRTGFLIKPGDVGSLARHLGKLVSSAQLRHTMGRVGYQRASRHFRWERVVDVMAPHLDIAAVRR